MSAEVQKSVRDMIKAELEGNKQAATPRAVEQRGALPGALGAPLPAPQPLPASQPKVIKLEPYEALMADAIKWRLDAAEKAVALATVENKECNRMRSELLNLCVQKYNVDVNTQNIKIDSRSKTLIIESR